MSFSIYNHFLLLCILTANVMTINFSLLSIVLCYFLITPIVRHFNVIHQMIDRRFRFYDHNNQSDD